MPRGNTSFNLFNIPFISAGPLDVLYESDTLRILMRGGPSHVRNTSFVK